MKEFFVKGKVAWTVHYVFKGESGSKDGSGEFDRFVKAESAKAAAEAVSARVIEQHSRSSFGTKSNVRVTEIAVYEKVEV